MKGQVADVVGLVLLLEPFAKVVLKLVYGRYVFVDELDLLLTSQEVKYRTNR